MLERMKAHYYSEVKREKVEENSSSESITENINLEIPMPKLDDSIATHESGYVDRENSLNSQNNQLDQSHSPYFSNKDLILPRDILSFKRISVPEIYLS